MSKQASPAAIGGFVVGAVALVIAGVLIFGSGKFFTHTTPAVMYFEGNVQGLQVGAALKFRGVPIGSAAYQPVHGSDSPPAGRSASWRRTHGARGPSG